MYGRRVKPILPVEEIRKPLTKEQQKYATILDKIVNNGLDKKNKMIPTEQQVSKLLLKCKDYFKNMSIMEWYIFLSRAEIRKFKKLYCLGENSYKKSLYIRAYAHMKKVRESTPTGEPYKFIYMDGHGRYTFELLKVLMEHGINPDTCIFRVHDIDDNANLWHKYFFPQGGESKFIIKHLDILTLLKPSNLQDAKFTYMNFCGLGNSSNVQKFIDRLNSFKKYCIEEYGAFDKKYMPMISFSRIRGAKLSTKDLEWHLIHKFNLKYVNDGREKSFPTYN